MFNEFDASRQKGATQIMRNYKIRHGEQNELVLMLSKFQNTLQEIDPLIAICFPKLDAMNL